MTYNTPATCYSNLGYLCLFTFGHSLYKTLQAGGMPEQILKIAHTWDQPIINCPPAGPPKILTAVNKNPYFCLHFTVSSKIKSRQKWARKKKNVQKKQKRANKFLFTFLWETKICGFFLPPPLPIFWQSQNIF